MKKVVKIYEDGKQFLIEGSLSMELNNHGKAEVYEVNVPDKEFKEMMDKPDKVEINKIKDKVRIK